MSQRPINPFNPFKANQELESMSPKDAELCRQALVTELKSKIEATEQRHHDEQKSQAAVATKEREADTESNETLGSKLAKTEKYDVDEEGQDFFSPDDNASAKPYVPVSPVPPPPAGPSPSAISSITTSPPGQLFSGASMPARPSPCATSVIELAQTADTPMMFTPASMPGDHTITTNALKGAYEMEAAMANLTMSSTAQTPVKSLGSAGKTEKHLRKAISDVEAKLKAHEQARASKSQPDDSATSDEHSMSDDDDNSNEDEMSNEEMLDVQEISGQHDNTGSGKTRASIKLKLFRKAPQLDDTGLNAITKGMNKHTFGADVDPAEAIDESSQGQPLQKQSSELHERNGREKGRVIRRGRGKMALRSELDSHHHIGGARSTGGGQQAQTGSDQNPPLDLDGRDDTNEFDFNDFSLIKLDDSDDDMHENKDDELLEHARACRRSFEVEAEDYDDWEGVVDDDGDDYYGEYEDDEGDKEDEDAGEEENDDEDNEESEEAKLDNKYGWYQPQSDHIRFPPPPQPFFNMPSQYSSSRLEEPAGQSVTESSENGVSGDQTNKSLADELRRTRLDEAQPDAQQ